MVRGMVLALLLLGAAGGARAAVPENFQLRDTADFLALCTAVPGSETYVAAINFCHGYAVGAYQHYQVLVAASPGHRVVCPTEPRPTREQAIAGFVAWAGARPQYNGEPAVETIFRYLAETYPCRQ
jgi:hypothetical protein